MIRLFVALRPPRAVRARLLALAEGVPGARWQDDDQLHLTLRFIGEVERPVAEDVAVALDRVRAGPVSAALAGVGRFEKRGRTDTLWAGLTPADGLAALHRKIDTACVSAGLAPERRAFLPHITVARLSRSAGAGVEIERWLADSAGLSSEPIDFTHFTLFRSELGREGATYEAVARWALDGH